METATECEGGDERGPFVIILTKLNSLLYLESVTIVEVVGVASSS